MDEFGSAGVSNLRQYRKTIISKRFQKIAFVRFIYKLDLKSVMYPHKPDEGAVLSGRVDLVLVDSLQRTKK